eukprot:TRINITY_DN24164_c0_g1_i1.p1 TRINITY_DN24164_c0_g1~~TRINITY_DN24164_c0_g1_i1.p1  ORF type:complete len:1328 (+),score=249.02 TRINITY_DN24164_c0_g1_i1:89-4072(+)
MGIPRFYRWLSERYPLINEMITAEQIPEFDNLYLDMNGIIHNCSHNNTGGLCVKDEGEVFLEAFKYICRLFHIIRPQKLIYMAVDGCAPRAKMNQQRSRRFRAANDAREAREKAQEMGEDVSGPHFDSNCITPGTEFMSKLTKHLQFFICKKIQEDPLWQGVTVVLSGPDTPGEGEHKIMDYIRTSKAQPGFEPNQRHCLYGLDADLIMLALASHEPHFALLREEVVFGRRETKTTEQRMLISKDRFQLLHISLVREYLQLEFTPVKQPRYNFNLERLIDDFILLCVLVGNDFLPCLPFAEIGEGGIDDFFSVYKEHLQIAESEPWLTKDCGEVNFEQLVKFMKKYAELEDGRLEAACDEETFVLGKTRLVGPADAPDPPNKSEQLPIEHPPTADEARVQWYEVKFDIDLNTHQGTQQQRQLFQSYLEGLQWVMYYYYRGPDNASWSWYYPFYHAPMAFDLANYDKLGRPDVKLEIGANFKPFKKLMAVLPYNSKAFLSTCYQWLFESNESPILHFYPKKFEVDMDGVKVPWGGVTLIPWIDPGLLLDAMHQAEQRGPSLTDAERQRNSVQIAQRFKYDVKANISLCSPGQKYGQVQNCPVRQAEFTHPPLPPGSKHFLNDLSPGCKLQGTGFPSLHLYPLTHTFEAGIKVFQLEARGKGIIVRLKPPGPITPSEQAIETLLQAPSAQIDFPCQHRGKVAAVFTAYRKYYPGGKSVENNPQEHENVVWNVMQEWRKKGLSLEFESNANGRQRGNQGSYASEEELWRQPLVEVRVAESSYLDVDGRPQLRFKTTSELRLFHLVRPEEAVLTKRQRTAAERFPVGTSVVCIAPDSSVFGQVGRVEKSSAEASSIESSFDEGLTWAEQESLQLELSRVVQTQHETLKWHDLQEVARQTEMEASVARQILGSLMARCADNVREDIGMCLTISPPRGETQFLCLPCYSMKSQKEWWFSDLAVAALKDYKERFPSLLTAIRARRNQAQDLEQRAIFPTSPDMDWASKQLVKYCNSCAWKKLRLAPLEHMALTTESITQVVKSVDSALAKLQSRPRQKQTLRGLQGLYKAEDAGSRPPAELFPTARESLAVGQRGVYIKPHGLIPCGAKGTIIGVYGSGALQELELFLDEDSFGATDLRGRTPPMRGIQVPAATFMPLLPRLRDDGGLAAEATWTAGAATSAPEQSNGASSATPKNDVQASQALFKMLKSPAETCSNQEPALADGMQKLSLEPTSSATSRIEGRLQATLSGGDSLGAGVGEGILPPPGLTCGSAAAEVTPSVPPSAKLFGSAGVGGGSKGGKGGKGSSGKTQSTKNPPDWGKAFSDLLSLGKKR